MLGMAIGGMSGLLEEIGKKALNAFDNRLNWCAPGQKFGVDNQCESWRHRKWHPHELEGAA